MNKVLNTLVKKQEFLMQKNFSRKTLVSFIPYLSSKQRNFFGAGIRNFCSASFSKKNVKNSLFFDKNPFLFSAPLSIFGILSQTVFSVEPRKTDRKNTQRSFWWVFSRCFTNHMINLSNKKMRCNNKEENEEKSYDFDLIVIGGGSGGMAAAKEAAKHKAKVCIFDFVKPSTQGSKWGLGGTCVNVGCVPKKLMHYAANIGAILHHDARMYGWEEYSGKNNCNEKNSHDEDQKQCIATHNWSTLIQNVQNYIKSLNFKYRVSLKKCDVEYINALAVFKDNNTICYTLKDEERTITGRYILIAVGGRPSIPDIPGAKEYAITSDDIFFLNKLPGNVLVVGASYIALECAGFLTELGYPVTVAVRSILLRGFDRQCAEKIGLIMKELGTKILHGAVPKSLKKKENGKILVEFQGAEPAEFDTVLYATGRLADTNNIGLEKAGVLVKENGKIETKNEQTNVSNIFAVGDCVYGRPELTPVAIKAGELLARRLFANSNEYMDYDLIPTTVFTPVEYGCCGLSEEQAIEKYGKENVEVYLSEFTTLELSAAHRNKCEATRTNEYDVDMSPWCLSKLVCIKNKENNNKSEKVVGFHFVGSNSGEITQGMALALKLGATKADFDKCVGIHPTDAESFVALNVTRSSGENWIASGGCGGGKCG